MHLCLAILKERWLWSQLELGFNYFSSACPLATCSTILESIPTSTKWDYHLTSCGGWEAWKGMKTSDWGRYVGSHEESWTLLRNEHLASYRGSSETQWDGQDTKSGHLPAGGIWGCQEAQCQRVKGLKTRALPWKQSKHQAGTMCFGSSLQSQGLVPRT